MTLLKSRLLGWLLGLVILGVIGVWLSQHGLNLGVLLEARPDAILALVPACILTMLLIGLANQKVAKHLGAPLHWREWSSLAFASTFANHFLPMKAGLLLRATYYRVHKNLSFGAFTSITALLYVIALATNSSLGLASYLWGTTAHIEILALFCGGILVCLIALLIDVPRLPGKLGMLASFSATLSEGWRLSRKAPGVILNCAAINLLLTLIYGLRLLISFAALGVDISLSTALFVGALVALSGMISLTPAGLGIRELTIVLGVAAIGGDPQISLSASLIDRMVSVVVVAVLGGAAMLKVSKTMATTVDRS